MGNSNGKPVVFTDEGAFFLKLPFSEHDFWKGQGPHHTFPSSWLLKQTVHVNRQGHSLICGL